MKKIIVLTGTPGAGKTTVLKKALENLDINVKITNFADNMLAVGEELGLGSDHDAIRKQPVEVQKDLQKKAAEKIAQEAAAGDLLTIVDTHATVRTKEGYLPGLPEWVIVPLKPKIILVIEADPEEIIGRRNKDQTRQRDKEDKEGIKMHQDVNRKAAQTAADLCGASVKVIENHDNGLEKAAEDLAKLLEN
jgi:adenylate kinase